MRLAPTFFPFLTPFEVEGNLGYSVAGNVLSQSEGGRWKRVPARWWVFNQPQCLRMGLGGRTNSAIILGIGPDKLATQLAWVRGRCYITV